jgi:hypothetical protein
MGKVIKAPYRFITNRSRVFQLDGDTSVPYETKGPVQKPPEKVVKMREKHDTGNPPK